MIINITQHCTLRCPHCMQNAGPERTEYMDRETFNRALSFAQQIGSRVILISGGEPTSHPDFLTLLDDALTYGDELSLITIISNGTFIRDHALTEELVERVKEYGKRLRIQVSSFKGLYSNYDELHKPGLRAARVLGDAYILCDKDTDIRMQPLGRAASGVWYEKAKAVKAFPSCANNALAVAQMPMMAICPGKMLESIHKFCAPIVSYDGSIRMGESEQCKVIANINDPRPDILSAIASFRPCGGCDSYKWHFADPQTEQEKQILKILNK